jgi:hypothetical protein
LDANYTSGTLSTGGSLLTIRSDNELGQTFTVLNSGDLTQVDLMLSQTAGNTAGITLDVTTVSANGLPTGTVLASETLASNQVASGSYSQPVQTVFSLSPFAVTAGEKLAITLQSNSSINPYYWLGDLDWPQFGENVGTYAGGLGLENTSSPECGSTGAGAWGPVCLYNSPGNQSGPNADFSFSTYVNTSPVPLPAAAWLMVGGLGGLGAFARKRRTA